MKKLKVIKGLLEEKLVGSAEIELDTSDNGLADLLKLFEGTLTATAPTDVQPLLELIRVSDMYDLAAPDYAELIKLLQVGLRHADAHIRVGMDAIIGAISFTRKRAPQMFDEAANLVIMTAAVKAFAEILRRYKTIALTLKKVFGEVDEKRDDKPTPDFEPLKKKFWDALNQAAASLGGLKS